MATSNALQSLVQQGLALQQQGKLAAAETYYTQALKIDPGEHRLYRDPSCIAALEEFLANAVR
jgi:Flp pilus assembly protein TadD